MPDARAPCAGVFSPKALLVVEHRRALAKLANSRVCGIGARWNFACRASSRKLAVEEEDARLLRVACAARGCGARSTTLRSMCRSMGPAAARLPVVGLAAVVGATARRCPAAIRRLVELGFHAWLVTGFTAEGPARLGAVGANEETTIDEPTEAPAKEVGPSGGAVGTNEEATATGVIGGVHGM